MPAPRRDPIATSDSGPPMACTASATPGMIAPAIGRTAPRKRAAFALLLLTKLQPTALVWTYSMSPWTTV